MVDLETYYLAIKEADAVLGIENPQLSADALNKQTKPAPLDEIQIVDVTHFLRRLIRADGRSAWLHIKSSVETNPAAAAAVDLNDDPRTKTINLGDPVVQGLMQALIQSGLLSSEEAAALLPPPVPAWPNILTDQDIIHARSM